MSATNRSSFSRLLRRIRRAIRRRWGSKNFIVYFKTAGDGAADTAMPGGIEYRLATREDIPWMSQYLGEWAKWSCGGREAAPEKLLAEQFDADDITVIATEGKPGGALVLILSVCRDELALRLMGEAFTPGADVSLRRAWVAPDYRQRGIGAGGEAFAETEIIRRGLMGIWTFIQVENTASQKLQEKLGYRKRGVARIVTRLRRRYAAVRLDSDHAWRRQPLDYSVSHL